MTATGVRFAVLGPGGVGGLVAASLARAGTPVVVVAREQTSELINDRGIAVRSVLQGDYVQRVAAVSRLDQEVDVLVVATKAVGLDEAQERVGAEAVDAATVVPLLNGVEHLETLRERFGGRVCAASVRVEADRPEPGVVVHTSPFLRIELASDGDVPRERLSEIAASLERSGIPAAVGDSEAQVMWSKLTRLCALAITTSAFDCPLGEIRDDPDLREQLEASVAEAAAVARAEGASIEAGEVMAELEAAHASLGSSMQRDIAAGRPPELDQIPGAVIRAGARHGIECPTIERLTLSIGQRLPAR